MKDVIAYFITWTTYGTWLPGDSRGWRKWQGGDQLPQPKLEQWCRTQMKEDPVIFNPTQRDKIEEVCYRHAEIRNWQLHAVSARTNHVHLAVTADAEPKKTRDQFKANATRVLRESPDPVLNKTIWTTGGDIEFIVDEESLEQVVLYIHDAQDRMDRGK